MVISEKMAMGVLWLMRMSSLLCRERRTNPIAAAPMTLGTAKTTQPQMPQLRTNSTGKNMPMHQVQEQARKKAQKRDLSIQCGLLANLWRRVKGDDAFADSSIA